MKFKLPAVAQAILRKRGAAINKSLRASTAQLISTCEEYGYRPHAAVIAFEEAFGGLELPEGPRMKKGEPTWLFGAHACLTSGAHTDPRGGSKARKLVPVVYSPNDVIYYLDEQGRGYAQDTIEDTSASRVAEDGLSLVCRIVFHDTSFSRDETSLDLPGLQGEALAKRLGLKLVKEASDKDRRFFCDKSGDMLVIEDVKAKQTRFAGTTKKQLALVKPPVAKGAGKPPAEAVPYLGKSLVRMLSEQRTSLPDFFEHLPDMRELDVSSNKLETLPDSLWRATQITSLDLSFNPLKTIPGDIANLKNLRSLSLRGCPFEKLPDSLAGAKGLTTLLLTESKNLDVDEALQVIAKLSKLTDLSLPLSQSLTSLAPLAHLPLKTLRFSGSYVKHPARLPAGLGLLKKLEHLRIEYADDIALLPEAPEDVRALRLIFSKKFSDDDIRRSVLKQPEVLYLRAFSDTL